LRHFHRFCSNHSSSDPPPFSPPAVNRHCSQESTFANAPIEDQQQKVIPPQPPPLLLSLSPDTATPRKASAEESSSSPEKQHKFSTEQIIHQTKKTTASRRHSTPLLRQRRHQKTLISSSSGTASSSATTPLQSAIEAETEAHALCRALCCCASGAFSPPAIDQHLQCLEALLSQHLGDNGGRISFDEGMLWL
jgi:hypothetical protein